MPRLLVESTLTAITTDKTGDDSRVKSTELVSCFVGLNIKLKNNTELINTCVDEDDEGSKPSLSRFLKRRVVNGIQNLDVCSYYRIQHAVFLVVGQNSRYFHSVRTFLVGRFVYITHGITKEMGTAVLVVMGRTWKREECIQNQKRPGDKY